MFSILADCFYFLSNITEKESETYEEVLHHRLWRLMWFCFVPIVGSICFFIANEHIIWRILCILNIVQSIIIFACFFPGIIADIKDCKEYQRSNK